MSVSKPEPKPDAKKALPTAVIVLVIAVISYMSLTKGPLTFLAVPSLLGAIPLLLFGQGQANEVIREPNAPRGIRLLAIAQVLGLVAAYACLPGVGYSSRYVDLGFHTIDVDGPTLRVWNLCWKAGAVIALASSLFLFVSGIFKKRGSSQY